MDIFDGGPEYSDTDSMSLLAASKRRKNKRDTALQQQTISDLMDERNNLQKELDLEIHCNKELREENYKLKERLGEA